MTVNDLGDRIRNKLTEIDSEGNYTSELLKESVNDALSGMVIPDLYKDTGLVLFNSLIINSASLSLTGSDPYVYDLSSESDDVFIPSLKAWVDSTKIEIMDLDEIPIYENDTLAYFRPRKLGAIVGLDLRVYDTVSDSSSLALDYVKIPDYALTDTIELDNSVILGLLLWASCYTATEGDISFDINEKALFLDTYHNNLNKFIDTTKETRKPPAIPQIQQIGEAVKEKKEAER
jgi:hypothetical protein